KGRWIALSRLLHFILGIYENDSRLKAILSQRAAKQAVRLTAVPINSPRGGSTTSMNLGGILRTGWEIFKDNKVFGLGVAAVGIGVIFAAHHVFAADWTKKNSLQRRMSI